MSTQFIGITPPKFLFFGVTLTLNFHESGKCMLSRLDDAFCLVLKTAQLPLNHHPTYETAYFGHFIPLLIYKPTNGTFAHSCAGKLSSIGGESPLCGSIRVESRRLRVFLQKENDRSDGPSAGDQKMARLIQTPLSPSAQHLPAEMASSALPLRIDQRSEVIGESPSCGFVGMNLPVESIETAQLLIDRGHAIDEDLRLGPTRKAHPVAGATDGQDDLASLDGARISDILHQIGRGAPAIAGEIEVHRTGAARGPPTGCA